MIEQSIQELIQYGIAKELVTEEDSIFLRNQLMDLLRLSSWETPALPEVLPSIDEILETGLLCRRKRHYCGFQRSTGSV